MNYYYSTKGTDVSGPCSFDDLRRLFTSGAIPRSTQICAEGTETWQPIAGLFPSSAQPPKSPPLTPQQQRNRNTNRVILAGVGVIVLACIILACVIIGAITGSGGGAGSGSSSSSSASKGTPNVSVGANDFVLRVTNKGTPDWNDMVIYLNGTPPFTYEWSGAAPEVGKSITIPLREFSKRNGERFDGYRTKVTQVWVGGGGYDYQGVSFGGN